MIDLGNWDFINRLTKCSACGSRRLEINTALSSVINIYWGLFCPMFRRIASCPQSSRRSRGGTAEPWPSCGAQPFEWRRCESCSAHRRCSLPSAQGAEGSGLAESTAFAEQHGVTLMENTILWLTFTNPWRKKSHGVKSSEFGALGVPQTLLLKLI